MPESQVGIEIGDVQQLAGRGALVGLSVDTDAVRGALANRMDVAVSSEIQRDRHDRQDDEGDQCSDERFSVAPGWSSHARGV
jgi:hypothetical protein